MSLPIVDFLADVAAVYTDGKTGRTFGAGRLIAPDTVLTAGHVVDYPTREKPKRSGWKICLLRHRARDGSWQASAAHKARLIWRGADSLDLALLKIERNAGDIELQPLLPPLFASFDLIGPVAGIDATGFPDGWISSANTLSDYTARGILRIASQFGPYVWSLPPADKPDDPHGWEGMSGAAACRIEWNGALYLFGAVQEVPANFTSGQLRVARLCDAFDDSDFVGHLRSALGSVPKLVPFELGANQADLGIAHIFQTRTQAFKDEYLISETNPVPFGGRDTELRVLDDWLLDPNCQPRMLMTAPAGRGKSALLVRWMKNLQDGGLCDGDGWQLAFMPISIRVGTNRPTVYYEGLARRLAEIAGETLPTDPIREVDGFRYAIREILNRISAGSKHVLVVIDGLDEALQGTFDPAILPSKMPANLRVVLSARWQLGDIDSQGWLKRLGWDRNTRVDTFELHPLDAVGVADVLVKLGAPVTALAGQPALINRLVELSEGEPLLVRYYAEDLWQLTSKGAEAVRIELADLKPGFHSYFERWFDRQEQLWREENADFARPVIDQILSVLAFAFGPLGQRDVLELMDSIYNATGLMAPDRLLAPLRRFVFGDGKSGSGYVLSHPRIGKYLQEERFAAIGHTVRLGFAAWCTTHIAELNKDRENRTKEASRYVLQFLPEHLGESGGSPADYRQMLEDGWRRAWEAFEGADTGFAANVVKVRDILADYARDDPRRLCEPLIGLGGQIRSALCLSSICSINYDVPSALFALGIRLGVLNVTQALAALSLDPLLWSRADAFVYLIPYLSQDQLTGHARELVASLLATGSDPWHFISRLIEKAEPEQKAVLIELLDVLKDEESRTGLIILCAPYLANAPLREAIAGARALHDPECKLAALRWLALGSALAVPERKLLLAEAFSVAERIGEGPLRRLRLHTFVRAPTLVAAASPSLLTDLLAEIRDGGSGIAAIIAEAVGHLSPDERSIVAAARLTAHLGSGDIPSLIPLVRSLPADRFSDAIRGAEGIADQSRRADYLAALAAHAIEVGSPAVSELVVALCNLEASSTQYSALSKLAAYIRENDREALAAMIEAVSTGWTERCRPRIFAFLASLQPHDRQAKELDHLLENVHRLTFDWISSPRATRKSTPDAFDYVWARHQDNRPGRTFVLAEIAPLLWPSARRAVLKEALRAARSIPSMTPEDGRADALIAVARAMPNDARREVLTEAIEEARVVGDYLDKQRVLMELAPMLSPDLGRPALEVAATIESAYVRASVIEAFAPFVADEQLAPAVRECLAAAHIIGDHLARENTLLKLNPPASEERPRTSRKRVRDHGPDAAGESDEPPSPEHIAAARSLAAKVLRKARSGFQDEEVWDGDEQWVGALLVLLPSAPDKEKARICDALLAVAGVITSDNNKRGILAELAAHLRPDNAVKAWRIAGAIRDPGDRTEALAHLAPALPETEYASAIKEILAAAAQLRRQQLLAAVSASAPVIHAVGGDTAISETVRAIIDVGEWWP